MNTLVHPCIYVRAHTHSYNAHTCTILYTSIPTYVHTRTYTDIHVHTRTYTYIVHTHMRTHAHTCRFVHKRASKHTQTYPSKHTNTHTYTHRHPHTHTHTHTHTHKHTHTHTHTHEHTHAHTRRDIHEHTVTLSEHTLLLRQRHNPMIAGGSGDGQQVLVVVASVVEQEVAGELQKRQRGKGGTGGGA